MTEEELIRNIENIRVCRSGDKRAPHKPLLLLYALSKFKRGSTSLIPYKEVKGKLEDLLKEFGPPVKTRHSTKDPFIRLLNDNFWQLNKPVDVKKVSDKHLLDQNVSAGFNTKACNLLKENSRLIKRITELLLEKHFNDTLHDDILTRVGLQFSTISIRKTRDPLFREKILRAYNFNCAICNFDLKIGITPLALEAAHIKWHKIGGPNIEGNGIALCVMHHKLFDQGAFTLNSSKEVVVSKKVKGEFGLREWLIDFDGKKIKLPSNPDYQPNNSFILWHVREVFK